MKDKCPSIYFQTTLHSIPSDNISRLLLLVLSLEFMFVVLFGAGSCRVGLAGRGLMRPPAMPPIAIFPHIHYDLVLPTMASHCCVNDYHPNSGEEQGLSWSYEMEGSKQPVNLTHP